MAYESAVSAGIIARVSESRAMGLFTLAIILFLTKAATLRSLEGRHKPDEHTR